MFLKGSRLEVNEKKHTYKKALEKFLKVRRGTDQHGHAWLRVIYRGLAITRAGLGYPWGRRGKTHRYKALRTRMEAKISREWTDSGTDGKGWVTVRHSATHHRWSGNPSGGVHDSRDRDENAGPRADCQHSRAHRRLAAQAIQVRSST